MVTIAEFNITHWLTKKVTKRDYGEIFDKTTGTFGSNMAFELVCLSSKYHKGHMTNNVRAKRGHL